METKISVIFCSKKQGEENKDFLDHIRNTCECDLNVICVHNPEGLSLSKIYADMTVNEQIDTNIIIFIQEFNILLYI